MIPLKNAALNFVAWLAERLGFALELPEGLLAGSLDEQVVLEQLGHGRD